jgi:N-acetylneuraminic acid mutarotase
LADPYSGGPSAEDLSRVDVYLPWTGRWEQARDLPIAVVQHAATVAPDGRIFVLGGWSPGMSGNSPDVYAYYPAGNAWTREASMPTGRSFLAAVTTGGKIYAIGGQKGSGTAYYATTEIYDLQSGTWSKGPDMPTARSSHSAAVGGDGRIYVLGGVRGALPTWPNEDQVATVEAYDPARDQWSTVASLPEARRGSAAVADAQGRIYALGGEHNYFPMGSADRYDPETDTWTELPDLPRQRRFHAATRGADGRIYLLAGHNRDGYVSLVDVFDPSIP